MDDEEIEVPSLTTCQRELADWHNYVKDLIARAKADIEEAEKLIRERDDKLLKRGSIGSLLAIGVGVLGVIIPPAAIPLACGAGGIGADAPVRVLLWRREKKQIEARMKESKDNIAAWEAELEDIQRAWRVIEQLAREEVTQRLNELEARQGKQLPPPSEDPLKRLSEEKRAREPQPIAAKKLDPGKGRRR